MNKGSEISRRQLLRTAAASAATALMGNAAAESGRGAPSGQQTPSVTQRVPLKIGHRAASMRMVGDFDVFRLARQIPELMGVELQAAGAEPNLRDLDVTRRYKREANRWGMMIPSVAGVWDRGVNIMSPEARSNVRQSIRAGELLGVRHILVATLNKGCPDMSKESSYGPVVELLADVARDAADAGVVLGIEASMSPEDHRKLIDLVNHPSVRVYYDIYNIVIYTDAKQAISGIKLLGKSRICQVHVKNENRLIEEPGPLHWKGAFEALNEIEYDGWFVFETQHTDRAEMLQATAKNIAFLQKQCRMPLA
jgi:sugar phosphate isomerase/epimerase